MTRRRPHRALPRGKAVHGQFANASADLDLLALLDSIPVGLTAIDRDGTVLFAGGKALVRDGHTGADMVGHSIWDYNANYPEAADNLRRGLRGEAFVARLTAGADVFELHYSPVVDENGQVLRLAWAALDVTDRVRAEQETQASEDKYRLTFESLYDVFYQTNRAGLITLMSPSCLRLTGYAVDELLGTAIARLWADPSELERGLSLLRASDELNDFEAAMLRKSGETIFVSVNASVLRDSEGRAQGFQGTLRDITQRKRLEEERDRIFTLSVDMLAVADARGRFQRVNPAWTATLGFDADELVGQSLWHFVALDGRADGIDRVRRAVAGEGLRDIRLPFRGKDGAYRWLSWNFAPALENGLTYCVVRDVTALVRTEQETEEMLRTIRASALTLQRQTVELDRLRAEADYQANHDVLTGAKNRRAWFADAAAMRPTAMAMFDIDHFKRVNDAFGHPVGDEVLKAVAERLQAALPASASFGRVGGEEFGVLWDTPLTSARRDAAAAVRHVASYPVTLPGGLELHVTVSAGFAPWQTGGRSREDALALTYGAADTALYEAKSSGRNTLVLTRQRAA